MPFAGFGPDALPFFKALAFHQTREWFEDNRAIFEGAIKQPLGDLVEALTERFAEAAIPLRGTRKTSVFRINRDVRFSKNKDPYKTNGGALLSRSGTKNDSGILYIHLGTGGCFAAIGFYMPEPQVLSRMRSAMVDEPKPFARVVAELDRHGLSLSETERLKRLPRGFEHVADAALGHALKDKSVICTRPFTDEAFCSPRLVDDLVAFARAARPLLEWGWSVIACAPAI